jgi:peroxiredoxin
VDYRDHYQEIRANGANVVAASVDAPAKSQSLRLDLNLPFLILCDTERRVAKDWDIYNPREKGGIAKPAVFVIDPDHTVRFASVDSVATRVPASEIMRVLETAAAVPAIRRRVQIPSFSEFGRGIRNKLRR